MSRPATGDKIDRGRTQSLGETLINLLSGVDAGENMYSLLPPNLIDRSHGTHRRCGLHKLTGVDMRRIRHQVSLLYPSRSSSISSIETMVAVISSPPLSWCIPKSFSVSEKKKVYESLSASGLSAPEILVARSIVISCGQGVVQLAI